MLMSVESLSSLVVIGVRYRGSRPAQGDERALDAYAASGVYQRAQVPVDVIEPTFPEGRRDEEADNIGLLGGAIADVVASARRQGKAVLMTGGDCTHASGILGGLQDAHGPAARIGLVWFDAHGDFNTPKTTLSGSLGGMPVAVCAGLAHPRWREASHIVAPLPTDRIVMVDVRNLDEAEEQLIGSLRQPRVILGKTCSVASLIWQPAVTCCTCTLTPTSLMNRWFPITAPESRTALT